MKSGYNLAQLVRHAGDATGVRRSDMASGDMLLLYTQNSIYRVQKLNDNSYSVSGGWFDQHHQADVVTSIVGCTWGGTSVHRDFVASCGMRVEFGNRVLTSILQRVVKIPAALMN